MSYRDVIGWQKAMDLAVGIYKFSEQLPNSEKYGIIQQLQRAAVSIPSNVADGYGRGTKADYARCVDIALGSTREAQTQLELCLRLGLGDTTSWKMPERWQKSYTVLVGSLRNRKMPSPSHLP